jgi:hypothetical protein
MARITRAAAHLPVEEVKARLKLDPRPWCRQRWLIIFNALVEPRAAAEIAKHTGTTVAMVHQVISTYNRHGVAAVETPGKGGRRHQYLTREEENAFLAPFFSRAEKVRLRQMARSRWPLKHRLAMRWMKVQSIVCSTGIAGANPFPVPSIRKPIQTHKRSLKKLCGHGRGGCCNPCSR